jgi:hypothetical protein
MMAGMKAIEQVGELAAALVTLTVAKKGRKLKCNKKYLNVYQVDAMVFEMVELLAFPTVF